VGDSTVSVFLGKGDGTFNAQLVHTANFAMNLAAGDFNGDGVQDLAVLDYGDVNGGPGNVLLMLGNGDGTFQDPLVAPAGKGPYSICVADLNRDGRLDAVVADYATGGDSISVLLGNVISNGRKSRGFGAAIRHRRATSFRPARAQPYPKLTVATLRAFARLRRWSLIRSISWSVSAVR
jgi:hypothetical protein